MNALGWREWAALPEIGVPALRAKIDTGARTSAINARGIEPFDRGGKPWVRFTLRPDRRRAEDIVCAASVTDVRVVKDSGGHAEERYVIETPLRIGERPEAWSVEITLADRAGMQFAMLVGRTAIRRRFVVDPGRSFMTGKPASPVAAGAAS
ncbi:MAG: RimK/LysX family protein [Gammaproteobacteria bacterium]|nr:RimK/LysX family protein [Gammaproteobacteria bacterium]MDE0440984.1 RimK/LysX family protein [Gammaproteobacteria bacterium]